MLRSILIVMGAAVCLAQTPKEQPKDQPKPPADVDKALRARIDEFFEYHVTGDFRKAEALVAEDTKDLFYNRNKPRYIKYGGIDHIYYSENFTKAYAVSMVVSPEMIAGWTGGFPNLPIPTTWKIENGKWCYYLEKETFLRTPFGNFPLNTVAQAAATAPGMMPAGIVPMGLTPTPAGGPPGGNQTPTATAAPGVPPMGGMPMMPGMTPQIGAPPSADPAALAAIAGAKQLGMSPAGMPGLVGQDALNKVKLDKTEVLLHEGKSDKLTFSNSAPDGRSLMILGSLPGVTTKLSKPDLGSGENAEITLEAGKDAKDGILRVVVPQTGEVFEIKVWVK